MASDLVLVIAGGELDGERFPLTSSRLTVGRAPGSDLLLKHASVSGKHALLKVVGDLIEVEDLGSTNGIYFEGERVESARVEIGQSFQIGKVRLEVVSLQDEAAETLAPSAKPAAPPKATAPAKPAPAPKPVAAPRAEPARARAAAAGNAEAGGKSEELKALGIGGFGAVLVLLIAFYVLRNESPAARQIDAEDEAAPIFRASLGSDAGFELDERDPGVGWETIPGSSGEATRSDRDAAEGSRCLKIELQPALGERYVPSVGVALSESRTPGLIAGEGLEFEVLARADADAGGAFATRYQIDDDLSAPASVVRGALIAQAADAEGAPGWKRLRLHVRQPDLRVGDARYDLGLLGWSARGGSVYFDAASVRPIAAGATASAETIQQPDVVELDDDGQFEFVWSGLGSALVGRANYRGTTRRLAVLRDLCFVPLETARPLWMDPNFAPLLAAGTSGSRSIPGAYLREAQAVEISWSWKRSPRGARHVIELELSRKGAGALPPLSFTLPSVLLAGNESDAVARFGGDELAANWILDEDAAARREGDAYPAVQSSDERLDGVVGVGFGSFALRSALRLDRPARAETRRVRGGISIALHATLEAGESLHISLGPIDAPSDLEIETARRTAQSHLSQGRVGAAVATLRRVMDRAVMVPNPGATQTRPNVDVVVRNQYGPLVQQLRQSMASAVARFDQVRREAEQALAVGAPDELRSLLRRIEEAQGLAEIYQNTSYGPQIDRLRATLRAGLEAAEAADPRQAARSLIADDLDRRRTLQGLDGPSPLGARLRGDG